MSDDKKVASDVPRRYLLSLKIEIDCTPTVLIRPQRAILPNANGHTGGLTDGQMDGQTDANEMRRCMLYHQIFEL